MTRLQHIALRTNDLEATCAFYLELLGLSGRCAAESGHLWVDFEDGFVLRFDRSDNAPDASGVQYLGLELANFGAVDQLYERLASRVSIDRDLREAYRHAQGPYGFFVNDPNGYLLKVFRCNSGRGKV